MKKLSLFLLSFAFMFAGCKSSAPLIEGDWETRALEIDGVAQEICVSNIKIEKGKNGLYSISGDSGVNRYFGSAKIDENSFAVRDDLASTKMAGEPRAMEFEDNFIKTLIEAVSFKIYKENGADFLALENANGSEKLVFIKK